MLNLNNFCDKFDIKNEQENVLLKWSSVCKEDNEEQGHQTSKKYLWFIYRLLILTDITLGENIKF